MLRIKKNDQVVVITGKDKGKTGRVLRILPEESRAIVEHINVVKKSQKKNQQNPQGGFIEREASIHISNIMLLDKKTNKPTRFGVSILKDGTKVRMSKKSGEVL
ncbi:MAG TPA: 50S ribosomal protein L24 [Candidatus Omnitrophica bacterium]|nr:MAG: 50S ribosomal protein L24 [Omnitrophica WOR_2 bacterium GWA2_45_18]OGX19673.1 MAG: 50S ribosomal protein L24 [Omnitrophica WOR_2 bacterium GWC2_45_7]HBR14647.1 50S ribosomal protein L24 [Candidatus Omnitrophota bacterium]